MNKHKNKQICLKIGLVGTLGSNPNPALSSPKENPVFNHLQRTACQEHACQYPGLRSQYLSWSLGTTAAHHS